MPKLKHLLTRSSSSLKVRTSIRRIRACPDPWSVLGKLIWPLPWRFGLPDRLLSVEDLVQNPELINYRQSGIRQLFEIPLFRARDTPLRSLYRLYEDLCADHFVMMGYECAYFFYQPHARWALSLPDPKDNDPVRYAILASMVEALVEAFNWRLELGVGIRRDGSKDETENGHHTFVREQPPPWTNNVTALDSQLNLMNSECESNPHHSFLKRNIKPPMGYLKTL
jgi:hypothetical protein